MKKYKIALVGNTNAGKTTFLNTICGTSQETSNYPGTTVEIYKAKKIYKDIKYEITDLPGIYSLTPFSDEERVAREILQKEEFDFVVQIIEPAFKRRSLALTLELMEMDLPVFLIINNKNNSWKKADIFLEKLEKEFGISGININALKKESRDIFFENIKTLKIKKPKKREVLNLLHKNLEKELSFIKNKLKIKNLWLALKILENDQEIIQKYIKKKDQEKVNKILLDKDYNLEIKNNRFRFIEYNMRDVLGRNKNIDFCCNKTICPISTTDKLDQILLNKYLGIPLFFLFMWAIFQATFFLGSFPVNFIDFLFASLKGYLSQTLPQNILSAVLIEGAISGVAATLVFLPIIMLLFFFLSILQQSGYLARTAYLMDGLMSKIGLGGKSFVPLLMGFGCSVPAIMAIRTLSSKKEKIITAMMIPFMSCSAKLPIYTLFIAAFFEEKIRGNVLFAIYIFGIFIGILTGLIFDNILKGKKRNLLLELPSYSFPNFRNIWQSVWSSAKSFLTRAGKIILPISILLWFLFSFPQAKLESPNIENSYASQIGKTIEPVFKPLGFDWRISTGLIAGLGAKEVFISTFGTFYSIEDQQSESFIEKLKNDPIFNFPVVFSLIAFILIYTPCVAAVSAINQELGIKWAIVGTLYPLLIAWLVSFFIYQSFIFLIN